MPNSTIQALPVVRTMTEVWKMNSLRPADYIQRALFSRLLVRFGIDVPTYGDSMRITASAKLDPWQEVEVAVLTKIAPGIILCTGAVDDAGHATMGVLKQSNEGYYLDTFASMCAQVSDEYVRLHLLSGSTAGSTISWSSGAVNGKMYLLVDHVRLLSEWIERHLK